MSFYYKFDSFYQILTSPDNTDYVEETSGKISGHAKLYSAGDCNFILKLESVNIIAEKDNIKKLLPSDEIPVKFSLNANGDLDPQICADESDNDYALNLKRSIISLFAMGDRKVETDIFGVCVTERSLSEGKQTTLKNLNKCSHRENFGLVKGIVDENSEIKSTPLLQGIYIRESDFSEHKFLNNVHVNEIYKFGDKRKTLVELKVSTNIKFEKKLADTEPKLINGKPTSIIFDKPKKYYAKNDDILKKQLKKTSDNFENFVKLGSADNFLELIRLMRHASTDSLNNLSSFAEEGISRKIYLDALYRTGTSKSVGAIFKEIPKMNDLEKRLAYLSFYLVDDVTKGIINQAAVSKHFYI